MKRFIVCIALISCFAACKNNNKDKKTTDENNTQKNENIQKITKRDYSIKSSNSYSDLFLDSNAVEDFIAEKKLNDTLARRMRSFYNARNYQFAWFSGWANRAGA